MTHRTKLKRIVTCQGSIQLVTALAALRYRESEQNDSAYEYEDLLVIYDLCAPQGQTDEFASFVEKMAIALCDWKAIVYIGPEQMSTMAASLNSSSTPAVFDCVYGLVGAIEADEIYLCRNWQFGNQLLINAYRAAEKICYGDGIGIYFSEAYFSPAMATDGTRRLNLPIGRKLERLKNFLRAKVGGNVLSKAVNEASEEVVLEEVDFDIGYFLLPDILGEQPPMRTRLVKKKFANEIFRKLAVALAADHTADLHKYLLSGPTVFLMTSNFSEAARMSSEKEIIAYREFLKGLRLPAETTLIIKPHPRDRQVKIQELRSAVGYLFSDVVLLTDSNLFFVPFEVFLMQVFWNEGERALPDLKVVTFSTACLSLELLFNLKPIIGFGQKLVSEFFYKDYVRGRIKHERDLHLALRKLTIVA